MFVGPLFDDKPSETLRAQRSRLVTRKTPPDYQQGCAMLKQLLIEVIGHVFGLSDEQLEQIEQSLPATKVLIVLLNKAHPIIEQAQTLDEETQPLANNVIF